MTKTLSLTAALSLALALQLGPAPAQAKGRYDPGASDTEIKIGSTNPYSGPAAAYATCGKAMVAYVAKVNAEGGVNGRKVNVISLDDAYSPPKTVEQVRKLVEQEEVLAMFGSLGSSQNLAVQKYLNARKVPQLFANSGATRWNDPGHFPWTMGALPSYQTEGAVYARHVLATKPRARIAILFQNDEVGKDYLKGFLDGLGDKAATMVVSQLSYETSDPTVESQVVASRASGADVFVSITTPKFAAQALRRVADLGWKPAQYLVNVSMSVKAVLQPAGLDNAVGVVSAIYYRDPGDPRWHGTPDYAEYAAFMKKYYPEGDPGEVLNVVGYYLGQALVQVLRQCGDDLTRANVMKQATSLDFVPGMLYPGIRVKTGPGDFAAIEQLQPVRFNGTRWEPLGELMGH
jgi:ABC-type branched-subunit amino acid transport system substrate-binding protein